MTATTWSRSTPTCAELAQVRDLVEQVERGQVDVGAARSMINTMTLRQNSWTLGTYCDEPHRPSTAFSAFTRP